MEEFPRQISRFLHQTTFSELWFSPIFYKKWDQLFRGTFCPEESLCSLCSTRLNQKHIRKKSYLIHPCKSVSSVVKNLSRSPCSPRSTRSNQSLLTAAVFTTEYTERSLRSHTEYTELLSVFSGQAKALQCIQWLKTKPHFLHIL